jgi:hypothetical protein
VTQDQIEIDEYPPAVDFAQGELHAPTGALWGALADAQAELRDAEKSSVNPAFKSRYADLAEVLQTVRPVLSKHGLALAQFPGPFDVNDKTASLTTFLAHKSGEYAAFRATIPVAKPDAQGYGGGITYLRRYSAAAVCGISQDDDDGNTATGSPTRHAGPARKPGKTDEVTEPAPAPMLPEDLRARFKAISAGQLEAFKALAGPLSRLQPADRDAVMDDVKAAHARATGAK